MIFASWDFALLIVKRRNKPHNIAEENSRNIVA